MPIRPARLNFGDTVGIVAPASPPADPAIIDRCVAAVEKLGFNPKLAPNVRKRNGFLAGSDRERASDLMKMFTDKKVNAIFSLRGGYGAARILPLLDYKAIRANPKNFLGYSDITSLHCALLTQADLISFHGPTLSFHFGKDDAPEFTRQSLLRTLMNPEPPGSIWGSDECRETSDEPKGANPVTRHSSPVTCLRGGKATGWLIGGNLSVLCTTIGTLYQPPFKNAILFLEDIGEAPYRMDRMLTHLLNAGLLQQVAGVAVGVCKDCEDSNLKVGRAPPRAEAQTTKPGLRGRSPHQEKGEFRQTLDDVLKERLMPLKIPIVTGLPFGHVQHNATLPVGARVMLDADNGDLRVIQSAVI